MSSETPEKTVTVEGASQWKRKCLHGELHIHRDDVKQIWKECREESFWYRALPISLGSMALTGGLIYKGVWNASKKLGPFPKLAVAGIFGYALGNASYIPMCRNKFQRLGPVFDSEVEGFGCGPGPFGGSASGSGYRPCKHLCEECQTQTAATPTETASTGKETGQS